MADIKMTAAWEGGMKGEGKITGEGWDVGIGIPAEFGGSGAGADPKSLFTSATLACFTATLRAITANKKVPVEALSVETSAHAANDDFSIRHIAKLVLAGDATDADRAAAENAIATADKICVVGNLAKKAGVTIEVTPEITIG
ncbi:OsmC family protein [Pseudooceanicola sp. CBS1P-1]|uniref:Osmotically inducible protein OsmC n=1 Tax=Pseudooceanicola albus TaxID=2692189 RepID=A0A6L7G9X6_9RHOB|nr:MULTISPECIES: OsmC family protein [Pseudooceanicola]MBT9386860.1 OsmC family protein [Pseudooceanicola endophyticus]MXN21004.1 osmotically inducible protein OsmC [Pseudooceanicola albus]